MNDTIEISDDIVFFVHIPKCAGTSIGSFFNARLRPSGQFFWHGQDGDINQIAKRRGFSNKNGAAGIRFIGGHFTIDAARQIILDTKPTNPKICTIIRNPIEQAESYFHWITSESKVKGAAHPLHHYCKQMTPLEFFNDELIFAEVGNIQSKYILGVDGEPHPSYDIPTLSLHLLLHQNFYIADLSQSDLLVSAVSNLLSLNCDDAEGLVTNTPRKNVSGARKYGFDNAVIELLNEKFQGDISLYNTLRTAQKNLSDHVFF